MRRLTGIEKKAALVVIGLTVMVAESGWRLLKKHARYTTQKAAATFEGDEDEELTQEALSCPPEEEVETPDAQAEQAWTSAPEGGV